MINSTGLLSQFAAVNKNVCTLMLHEISSGCGVKYTVHANKCALEWKVLQSYLLKLNLMEKTENENKNKDKKTHRKSEPTYQSCKS